MRNINRLIIVNDLFLFYRWRLRPLRRHRSHVRVLALLHQSVLLLTLLILKILKNDRRVIGQVPILDIVSDGRRRLGLHLARATLPGDAANLMVEQELVQVLEVPLHDYFDFLLPSLLIDLLHCQLRLLDRVLVLLRLLPEFLVHFVDCSF